MTKGEELCQRCFFDAEECWCEGPGELPVDIRQQSGQTASTNPNEEKKGE